LFCSDVVLERLPQDLQDMAAALGPCIQEAHPVVRERHLARPRPVAPADQAHIGDHLRRPRHGRAGTNAGPSPVRPSMRWMHVVSMASARVMAGRIVVSRRASIDLPAPRGRGGGDYGQNACMTFRFTNAFRDAD
jgi:hypothetical protein